MFSIMIVDDEKSVREGLKNYLSRQENLFDEVYSAVNGEEALELMQEKQPQVIVTDINMPHMDGLEFIELLKKQRQDVQIIVLSGYDDFTYAQRAMRNGVEHYLLKPVDRKELVELLSQMKEAYFRKLRAREENVQEKERVHKQQQLLCSRLLNILLDGPINKNQWRYELELLNLWQEDVAYAVCIKNKGLRQEQGAGDSGVRRTFRSRCEAYGLGQLLLQEQEEEQVILLTAASRETEGNLKAWIEQVRSGSDSESELKFGTIVDDIAQVHASYEAARKDSMLQQQDIAQRALLLIQTKWNDPKLTLNDIAGELYVSHNYLRYLIKEKTGMSFVKYLTEIRLERAAAILSSTGRKVQEVALEVGFEDAGYFTRVFTKKYECSPSKYREKLL